MSLEIDNKVHEWLVSIDCVKKTSSFRKAK